MQRECLKAVFLLGVFGSMIAGCSANSLDPLDTRSGNVGQGGSSGSIGRSGSGGGAGTSSGKSNGSRLPCDVAGILSSECHECHGTDTLYDAPMSLVTYEDLQAKGKNGEPYYKRVLARIKGASSPMPPAPRSLDASQIQTIESWVNAGAPPDDGTTCGGGEGGAGGFGGTSAGGSGGTDSKPPLEKNTTPCTSYKFQAHGARVPGDKTPFTVHALTQTYQCFYFKVPWTKPVQAIRFNKLIDNTKVLHHWLLYTTLAAPPDGDIQECLGVHKDATLIAGYAPGGNDWVMPKDVGMELPAPGTYLMLELHYSNVKQGAVTQTDGSGVDVCATEQKQAHAASVTWLGTESIFLFPNTKGDTGSTCSPRTDQGPIHILRSWPHMHQLGRHMKTEIIRQDGSRHMLDDRPFDFNNQIGYEQNDIIVNPGDKIETKCSFENNTPGLVTFGPATEQEMCYNFIVSWPAGALSSLGLLMNNSCML